MARKSYVQVWNEANQRHELQPKDEYRPPAPRTHLVMPDLPAYESPIDGRSVDGRRQRREDLKRNGCRPYEAGEREDAVRSRRDARRRLEASMVQTMRDVMS